MEPFGRRRRQIRTAGGRAPAQPNPSDRCWRDCSSSMPTIGRRWSRPNSAAFEVDAAGRFEPYPHLAEYWSANDRWPLLIQTNGRTVGFALINTLSHQGGGVERNMAEFFVARKHRRRHVATAAVQQILRLHPGHWEIAVAERNKAAQAFWAKALAAAANVSDLHIVPGDGEHWRGPIWCFRAISPDGPPG